MGGMASQITSLTIVYSTVYWGADQRKHKSSELLAFVQGIHWGPVNSPHKWPVTPKVFPFDMTSSWYIDDWTKWPLVWTRLLQMPNKDLLYLDITEVHNNSETGCKPLLAQALAWYLIRNKPFAEPKWYSKNKSHGHLLALINIFSKWMHFSVCSVSWSGIPGVQNDWIE